jgi:hypothetical protein
MTPYPALSRRTELAFVVLASWLIFIAIPLTVGMGISWDALNHHLYLGWVADSTRFDKDFLAAAYQSFQYPYLYWPFYKLYQAGAGPAMTGVVLDSLYVAAVPALWLVAYRLVPDAGWWGTGMRVLAVALSFMTGVVLSMLDTTANDLLAAIPLVWALALAVEASCRDQEGAGKRLVAASGACAGLAVAFKLSNGPLALVLPFAWAASAGGLRVRIARVAAGGAATLLACALAYGPWGYELWSHYGNPVYPFADSIFAPARQAAGRP